MGRSFVVNLACGPPTGIQIETAVGLVNAQIFVPMGQSHRGHFQLDHGSVDSVPEVSEANSQKVFLEKCWKLGCHCIEGIVHLPVLMIVRMRVDTTTSSRVASLLI